ncbi:MAG: hypothetical protein OXG02_03335 [Chloroflexi bacterium]|nr:hypothetical protein [Chloroflexota bacterium]MCY4105720.1 hypothetical protein [Chloroflexota bacterium]
MSKEKKDPYDDFLTVFSVSLPFQRWNANPLPPSIKDSPDEIQEETGQQPQEKTSNNWLLRAIKETARFLTGRQ